MDSFTSKMKSQSILYLLNKSDHNLYIGFWTLKVKNTQYGISAEVALKNARAMIFSKLGGADSSFWSYPVIPISLWGLPLPASTSPKRLLGGGHLHSWFI